VVTLFVFFSARTRHTRVAGPSVVPRTTAFRKIQLRRLNSVAATFSRLSSGTTVVVLTRVQRHRETCIIFEFWSCSWLLSSVVVQVNQLLHVLGCPRNDDLRTWRGRRGLWGMWSCCWVEGILSRESEENGNVLERRSWIPTAAAAAGAGERVRSLGTMRSEEVWEEKVERSWDTRATEDVQQQWGARELGSFWKEEEFGRLGHSKEGGHGLFHFQKRGDAARQ
jgi:hypothetical protein